MLLTLLVDSGANNLLIDENLVRQVGLLLTELSDPKVVLYLDGHTLAKVQFQRSTTTSLSSSPSSTPAHFHLTAHMTAPLTRFPVLHCRVIGDRIFASFLFPSKSYVPHRLSTRSPQEPGTSLLLLDSALTPLHQARIFTKVDLRNAYHLICICQRDEWKTECNTQLGHPEYQVMPFVLTNASAIQS